MFEIGSRNPKFQLKHLAALLTEYRNLSLNICSAAGAEDRNLGLIIHLSFGPKTAIAVEVGCESIWLSDLKCISIHSFLFEQVSIEIAVAEVTKIVGGVRSLQSRTQ